MIIIIVIVSNFQMITEIKGSKTWCDQQLCFVDMMGESGVR